MQTLRARLEGDCWTLLLSVQLQSWVELQVAWEVYCQRCQFSWNTFKSINQLTWIESFLTSAQTTHTSLRSTTVVLSKVPFTFPIFYGDRNCFLLLKLPHQDFLLSLLTCFRLHIFLGHLLLHLFHDKISSCLLKGEGFQRKLLNHISYSCRILLHAWDSQKWKQAARSRIAILDLKRLTQKAWRKHWQENSASKKRVQGINCCLLYSSIDIVIPHRGSSLISLVDQWNQTDGPKTVEQYFTSSALHPSFLITNSSNQNLTENQTVACKHDLEVGDTTWRTWTSGR